jgi:hypothetical protein
MVPTATLPLMLKQLNLTSMARHWQTLLETGRAQRLGRRALPQRAVRARAGRSPQPTHRPLQQGIPAAPGKSLASFDFSRTPRGCRAHPGPGRVQRLDPPGAQCPAVRCQRRRQDPPGRRHRPCADRAQRARALRNTTALVQQLQLAREQLRLEDALHKLDKCPVLILDDFGYVKKSQQETQVLFELIAHRYERASLIITSNQAFADWDQIFPDQMMTVAAVDRLVHHASIIEIGSDSYRRKHALGQRGSAPATTPTPSSADSARRGETAAPAINPEVE